MNRCENYTLACEANDCCECDMFRGMVQVKSLRRIII